MTGLGDDILQKRYGLRSEEGGGGGGRDHLTLHEGWAGLAVKDFMSYHQLHDYLSSSLLTLPLLRNENDY